MSREDYLGWLEALACVWDGRWSPVMHADVVCTLARMPRPNPDDHKGAAREAE